MLPLPLNLHDPMGQAKSGQLPSPIDVTGAEPVFRPRVGELYYWAPSHTVAIFYDDLGQSVPRLAWSVSESWTAASPRSARPVTDSPSGSSWLTAQSRGWGRDPDTTSAAYVWLVRREHLLDQQPA